MSDLVEVHITAPDAAAADRLATLLVSGRYAACVQIVPGVTSTYRWQGAIEQAAEHLLLAKTTSANFPELAAVVRAAHPYVTPEILALPITHVDEAYAVWLGGEVGASADG